MALTRPSLYATHERSSGPSHHPGFCCPAGSSGTTAASDAHPATPPTSRDHRLHPFHGLRPDFPGSAPPRPPEGRVLTTRQASLHAADRSVAPPEGLLTLGFDPARFPTEPPACYRASRQLPGRDSHPLATTSFCWIRSPHSTTSNAGRTKNRT